MEKAFEKIKQPGGRRAILPLLSLKMQPFKYQACFSKKERPYKRGKGITSRT